jgi:hypothetical protein
MVDNSDVRIGTMNGMPGHGKRLGRMLAGLLLAATFAGTAAAAQEQGGEVVMVVKGVVAPYATFGLLKHLGGIPGVAAVTFNLLHGTADIKLKPGASVTDQQLRDAVISAAYTPGDIHWKTETTTASSGQ